MNRMRSRHLRLVGSADGAAEQMTCWADYTEGEMYKRLRKALQCFVHHASTCFDRSNNEPLTTLYYAGVHAADVEGRLAVARVRSWRNEAQLADASVERAEAAFEADPRVRGARAELAETLTERAERGRAIAEREIAEYPDEYRDPEPERAARWERRSWGTAALNERGALLATVERDPLDPTRWRGVEAAFWEFPSRAKAEAWLAAHHGEPATVADVETGP